MRFVPQSWHLLLLLAAAGFPGFLGQPPLFDWDEINFAEAAREMLVTGNFLQVQINFQPFWEKPPLFFWLQALCMAVFGVGEFAARLPNAIVGIFTIWMLFREGRHWRNELFGTLVALFYLATLLPAMYFKTGIIDPTFNFFIFLGLMQLFRHEDLCVAGHRPPARFALLAGMWIGLAVLTKGPVAMLVTGLVYGLYKLIWSRKQWPWLAGLWFLLAFVLTIGSWYGVETAVHGPWFVNEFLRYQVALLTQDVAGHAQPFYYHGVVFLLGCFPMAAFALRGMVLGGGTDQERLLRRLMILWFWVVMVLFSAVKTKIIHYSSLLYFPGAFLAADLIHHWVLTGQRPRWDTWLLLGLGLVAWGLGPSLMNVALATQDSWIGLVKDPMAVAALEVDAGWTGFEWLIGLGMLAAGLWFIRQIRQGRYLQALWGQAIATLVFLNLMFVFVVPKIGAMVQGAPQDFFEQVQGKPVYVMSARYKSYLPYFYSQIQPPVQEKMPPADSLVWGKLDRDVYLSVKAPREDAAFQQQFPTFERLYEQGGFVFYRRTFNRTAGSRLGGEETMSHTE